MVFAAPTIVTAFNGQIMLNEFDNIQSDYYSSDNDIHYTTEGPVIKTNSLPSLQ